MRRLILESPPDADGLLRFSGSDFRYLARVLRKAPGDTLRVLLPGGAEALAEVVSVDSKTLTAAVRPGANAEAAVDAQRRSALASGPPLVLIQALPKAAKMDDVVRQATELGAALILPFVSERSVSRPEPGRSAEGKRERWMRIVREARQQSGSDVPTEVREPTPLRIALAAWAEFSRSQGGGVGIFLHQDPLAQGSMHGYLNGGPQSVALAVGPEGGFSESETAAFSAAGFLPALLGVNVLRAETAAVAALAAAQVILLEKTSWMPKTPDSPASNG